MLSNIHHLSALQSTKHLLAWKAPRTEGSIHCTKEGPGTFLGTVCSFEAGDTACVTKFKYYFIGSGEMMKL